MTVFGMSGVGPRRNLSTGGSSIKDLFFSLVRDYGAVGILVSLMLEYLGLPIPGESLMLMLGFICRGGRETAVAVLCAAAGTFLGSIFAYAVGRRFGERVLLKVGRPFHLTRETLDRTDRFIRKHDAAYIVASRFIPGVRHVVPYLSGISGVSLRKVLSLNLLSAAIWCAAFILAGHTVGSRWATVGRFVGTYTVTAFALLLFLLVVWKFFRRYRITVTLFALSLMAFILFCSETTEDELRPFDTMTYDFLSGLISKNMTAVMRLVTGMGSMYFLSAAALVLLAMVYRFRRRQLFFAGMACVNLALVSLLNVAFKLFFHRPRPDILRLVSASGYSFPSGHSMVSAGFFGYLIYLIVKNTGGRWKAAAAPALLLLILLIGVSRVYLGVHYASDVVGGYLAGFAWLVVFVTLSNAFRAQSPRRQLSSGE